jgi:hypothetical protein
VSSACLRVTRAGNPKLLCSDLGGLPGRSILFPSADTGRSIHVYLRQCKSLCTHSTVDDWSMATAFWKKRNQYSLFSRNWEPWVYSSWNPQTWFISEQCYVSLPMQFDLVCLQLQMKRHCLTLRLMLAVRWKKEVNLSEFSFLSLRQLGVCLHGEQDKTLSLTHNAIY